MNNIVFIILAIIILLYVVNSVRKKRFSIKESFWWIVASVIMLLLAIFPHSIDWIAQKIGVAYPPSLLFVACIIFLILINFRDSKRISELQTKVIELGQELSILKEKVNKNVK